MVVYMRLFLFERRRFQGGVLLLPSCQKRVDYIVPAFGVFNHHLLRTNLACIRLAHTGSNRYPVCRSAHPAQLGPLPSVVKNWFHHCNSRGRPKQNVTYYPYKNASRLIIIDQEYRFTIGSSWRNYGGRLNIACRQRYSDNWATIFR